MIGYCLGQDTLKPQDSINLNSSLLLHGKTLKGNNRNTNLLQFFRGNFYQQSLFQRKDPESLKEAESVISAARKASTGPNLNKYHQVVRQCV